MSARLRRGYWCVDFYFERQRIRAHSPVNTKRGAEEYERQLRQKLLDGTYGKEAEKEKEKSQTKFKDFVADFMEYARSNNKPSEVENKQMILRLHLVPAFGELELSAIKPRLIEQYKGRKLQAGLAKKSINNHLTVLHKLLSVAEEWELVPFVPKVKWLKAPKPEFDFLDFEEAERLVAAAGEWETMIVVALKTGLRQGELLALRWEDVDLVRGRLLVRQSFVRGRFGTPKNGKPREVPLSKDTVQLLKSYRHLKGELVFCEAGGEVLTKNMCRRPLYSACKRAGLRLLGWHVLRHTFASHLVMRGVPIKAVQELLGHATIEMTMRYAHLAPAARQQAVDALDEPAPFGHQLVTSQGSAG